MSSLVEKARILNSQWPAELDRLFAEYQEKSESVAQSIIAELPGEIQAIARLGGRRICLTYHYVFEEEYEKAIPDFYERRRDGYEKLPDKYTHRGPDEYMITTWFAQRFMDGPLRHICLWALKNGFPVKREKRHWFWRDNFQTTGPVYKYTYLTEKDRSQDIDAYIISW